MHFLFQREKSTATAPLVPTQARVPELRQAELAAVYYGQRIAGDFYDFIRVNSHRVLFGLLDVAGRLQDNRAIISSAQDTFRELGAELLAKDDINEADAMNTLCLELNRTILKSAGGVCACPAFGGCYNEDLGTVCYFNAGHTPGLLRDSTGITELKATGLPLGLFSHATCDAPIVVLEPGAVLLLVSQGIIEARYKGDEFGLGQVKKNFENASVENAKALCLAILGQVQQFMRTSPTHNDVTALALVRAEAAAVAKS